MVAHSATLEINERVAAYRDAGRKVLHLGFGEAGLPVHPALADRLHEAVAANGYAPVAGSAAARQAAAGYWSRRGLPTGPDQVLLAPGSKPLLYAVLAAVGGDVVLPVPSWVTYAAQAALAGRKVIGVPVADGYGGVPDPDRLVAVVRDARAAGADPRLLVVTLPDNPTGTLAPEHAVREVCAIAEREGLVVLSDEIYRDLVHDGGAVASPASYLPQRTIVTGGLSKNLALGGWRIGFARLPDTAEAARWRDTMLGVASELWSCIASPMENVAVYALDEPAEVVEHVTRARRLHGAVAAAVAETFAAAGATLRTPDAAFYLYPDLEAVRPGLDRQGVRSGADLGRYLLDEHGLAVLPGESFGDAPDALRFRVATSLLYGDTEKRWAALASDDPVRLPWIAGSLEQLRGILGSVANQVSV
ncbi:MAG: aminotransferase class I/II-fold pyridoxal phosphate-dependent enzyme [Streptosporangiales bacterium]|nr:aminotransferase class I/II-fold pyridoxal phosphate-dependent enzyme [Streptosporangiales bacterium]